MAAVKGIKLPKKAKKGPVISVEDSRYMGTEPKWDTERATAMTDAEFDHQLAGCFRWYNYFFSQKELKGRVVEWAQANMKLTKEQLSLYILSNTEFTPMTACSLVKAASVGMPMRQRHKDYVIASIMKAIKSAETQPAIVEKVAKKESYTPTIQDRLAEKTSAIIGEIEGQVDNAFTNKPTISIYDFITTENLAQAQVGKVRSHFQKQIDEISVFAGGQDEQLNEAYSHLSKADIKRIGAFYVKLLADLESYTAVKKATKKIRIKKAPSKDKVIAKLKFLKEDKGLKLVSIPPTDIIGAQMLWVYDTKARKLMRYVADSLTGPLNVKGTTIVGFDTVKSIGKTLRKPEEQLKEFSKASKVELRKFLENIKAVETKANGRMNDKQILLKVA